MSLLVGIHPVREALRAGRPLERVLIVKGAGGARLQEVIALCRERNIPVRFEPKDQLDRASNGAKHQGVLGFGSAERYSSLEDTMKGGGLHVILDGVEDRLGALGGVVLVDHQHPLSVVEAEYLEPAGMVLALVGVQLGDVGFGGAHAGGGLHREIPPVAAPHAKSMGGRGVGTLRITMVSTRAIFIWAVLSPVSVGAPEPPVRAPVATILAASHEVA